MIYRPHMDIEKSVSCLSEYDLYYVGRLNTSLLIQAILGRLQLIQHSSELLSTPTGAFYWNNGEPYLNDLVYYYNVAEELWLNAGGAGYRYLKEYEDVLEQCDFIEHEAPWEEEFCITHRLILLKNDHTWYKRKFLDLKRYRLIESNMYDSNGKPRRILQTDLMELCSLV